jgi:hypothetical protein
MDAMASERITERVDFMARLQLDVFALIYDMLDLRPALTDLLSGQGIYDIIRTEFFAESKTVFKGSVPPAYSRTRDFLCEKFDGDMADAICQSLSQFSISLFDHMSMQGNLPFFSYVNTSLQMVELVGSAPCEFLFAEQINGDSVLSAEDVFSMRAAVIYPGLWRRFVELGCDLFPHRRDDVCVFIGKCVHLRTCNGYAVDGSGLNFVATMTGLLTPWEERLSAVSVFSIPATGKVLKKSLRLSSAVTTPGKGIAIARANGGLFVDPHLCLFHLDTKNGFAVLSDGTRARGDDGQPYGPAVIVINRASGAKNAYHFRPNTKAGRDDVYSNQWPVDISDTEITIFRPFSAVKVAATQPAADEGQTQ